MGFHGRAWDGALRAALAMCTALLVYGLLVSPHASGQSMQSRLRIVESYRVQPGDTLPQVSRRFGCNTNAVISVNAALKNRVKLEPGEMIQIPACANRGRLPEPAMGCEWTAADIDHRKLRNAMLQEAPDFTPPPRFRALVVKIRVEVDPHGEPVQIQGIELFDYAGLASDATGWNPASTVKLFSGALRSRACKASRNWRRWCAARTHG